MKTYREKLKDPRWQKMRLSILERDDFACQICFDTSSTLHVHHRYYSAVENPWDYPLHALVTLCETCHELEGVAMPEASRAVIDALKSGGMFSSDMTNLANALRIFFHAHQYSMPMWFFDAITTEINLARMNPDFLKSLSDEYFERLRQHLAERDGKAPEE